MVPWAITAASRQATDGQKTEQQQQAQQHDDKTKTKEQQSKQPRH